jgi:hypothetical protein
MYNKKLMYVLTLHLKMKTNNLSWIFFLQISVSEYKEKLT